MRHRLSLAAVFCALAVAGGAAPAGAVVGGSDAAPGEFPSVAEITFGTFACTGTLIDPTHVLSAGHCANPTSLVFATPAAWPPELIDVRIGSNKTGKGEFVPVSKVTITPRYFGLLNSRHDLSILTLGRASTHAPTPVANASERSIWEPGVLETIAGWGATDRDATEFPDTLQKAQVPITTDAYCKSAYPDDEGWDFDPETMVCAGYPDGGVDACKGDSGGPLFGAAADGSRRVVGVTSWGEGCAEKDAPGVYARVADTTLRDWVASVAPNGVSKSSPSSGGTTTGSEGGTTTTETTSGSGEQTTSESEPRPPRAITRGGV